MDNRQFCAYQQRDENNIPTGICGHAETRGARCDYNRCPLVYIKVTRCGNCQNAAFCETPPFCGAVYCKTFGIWKRQDGYCDAGWPNE